MKKRWVLFIAVLAVLGGASYGASRLLAQASSGSGGVSSPRFAGRFVLRNEPGLAMLQNYLGITPDQRRKLAEVDRRFIRSRPILRERVWNARDHFLAKLRDPGCTDEEVIEALRDLVRAREEMAVNTVSYILEMRKHLTPDQQEKLSVLVERGMCGLTRGSGIGSECGRQGGGACGLGILGGKGPRSATEQ